MRKLATKSRQTKFANLHDLQAPHKTYFEKKPPCTTVNLPVSGISCTYRILQLASQGPSGEKTCRGESTASVALASCQASSEGRSDESKAEKQRKSQ